MKVMVTQGNVLFTIIICITKSMLNIRINVYWEIYLVTFIFNSAGKCDGFPVITRCYTCVVLQIRADSIQDLSYAHNERFSTLPKQFSFDSAFRHRTGSEDLGKDGLFSRDSAILPNKPSGPFSLGMLSQSVSILVFY